MCLDSREAVHLYSKDSKAWILTIHIPFQVLSKCRRGNRWKDIDLRGKGNPVSPHSLLTWNGWTTENTEKHRYDRPGCRNHLMEYNSVFSARNLLLWKCSPLEFLQNTWEKTFTHLVLSRLRKSEGREGGIFRPSPWLWTDTDLNDSRHFVHICIFRRALQTQLRKFQQEVLLRFQTLPFKTIQPMFLLPHFLRN